MKISWTIINNWEKGYKDRAVDAYLGVPIEENEQMQLGKEIHLEISSKELKLVKELRDAEQVEFEDFDPAKKKWKNFFKRDIGQVPIYDKQASRSIDMVTGAETKAEMVSMEPLTVSMVADVLYKVGEDNWGVIDWKTGRYSSTEQDERQLYLYALALRNDYPIKRGAMAKVTKENGIVKCTDYSVYRITPANIEYIQKLAIGTARQLLEYIGQEPEVDINSIEL